MCADLKCIRERHRDAYCLECAVSAEWEAAWPRNFTATRTAILLMCALRMRRMAADRPSSLCLATWFNAHRHSLSRGLHVVTARQRLNAFYCCRQAVDSALGLNDTAAPNTALLSTRVTTLIILLDQRVYLSDWCLLDLHFELRALLIKFEKWFAIMSVLFSQVPFAIIRLLMTSLSGNVYSLVEICNINRNNVCYQISKYIFELFKRNLNVV